MTDEVAFATSLMMWQVPTNGRKSNGGENRVMLIVIKKSGLQTIKPLSYKRVDQNMLLRWHRGQPSKLVVSTFSN
jgi:hypothetical protein